MRVLLNLAMDIIERPEFVLIYPNGLWGEPYAGYVIWLRHGSTL